MVRYSKWHVFVGLVVGLAVVLGSALYAANPQPTKPLHVASVEVSVIITYPHLSSGGPSAPANIYTAARVKIVDQGGQPVRGANVTGKFTGCDEDGTASAKTNDDGFAVVKGRRRKCGCVYTFTVTGVTKSRWTWNRPDPLPKDSRCLCGCN
jgi:hypothetical protein